MQFYGEPNAQIMEWVYKKYAGRGKRKMVPIGKFDEDGTFETDDERIIDRLKQFFNSGEKTSENKEKITINENAETVRKCKKCDFTCNSQGELLKHYRESHPKK